MPASKPNISRVLRVTALVSNLTASKTATDDESTFIEWLAVTQRGKGSLARQASELLTALAQYHRTTADKLQDIYSGSDHKWGAHPLFTPTEWRLEVCNDETRQGYWEWVLSQLDMEFCELEWG